jgi:excisionase family DNA binding protein
MTPHTSDSATMSGTRPPAAASSDHSELHELLTVDDVAALLKVGRGWVYERTRRRKTDRGLRLPYLKVGKYLRFDPAAVRGFLAKAARNA